MFSIESHKRGLRYTSATPTPFDSSLEKGLLISVVLPLADVPAAPKKPLKDYQGSGNSAIHKALWVLSETLQGAPSPTYYKALQQLSELLRDLKEAEESKSVEKLMDKWETRYPSGFVDLMVKDLPHAIAFAEQLHSEARSVFKNSFFKGILQPLSILAGGLWI